MAAQVAIFQEHTLLPTTVEGAIWPFNTQYWKPPHFHAQVEFLLLIRGRARARVGRATYTVHAGQLIWHLPGIEHELLDASADCDLRVVQAEPDLCADAGRAFQPRITTDAPQDSPAFAGWISQLGRLAAGRPVVELKRTDRDRVLDACDATCASAHLQPEQCSQRLRTALACAWRATLDDHDDLRPNSLVELACCALLEDPSLERSTVCRALDVSESYLSRRFRAELGVSFAEQRARLRLARFSTHVTREHQNYLASAMLAGFGSYSQLHRVFTELLSISPRDYFSRGGRNLRANLGECPR